MDKEEFFYAVGIKKAAFNFFTACFTIYFQYFISSLLPSLRIYFHAFNVIASLFRTSFTDQIFEEDTGTKSS
jgi:hypothetical protein